MSDPTDVLERAQAWLKAADERGINVTAENGYLKVIADLVAEVEFQRTAPLRRWETTMPHELFDKYFEPATAIQAEGARIGITTCKICGAAVLLDPREPKNAARQHYAWHIRNGYEP